MHWLILFTVNVIINLNVNIILKHSGGNKVLVLNKIFLDTEKSNMFKNKFNTDNTSRGRNGWEIFEYFLLFCLTTRFEQHDLSLDNTRCTLNGSIKNAENEM